MEQKEYHTLILAGLLHDVGKLLIKDPEEREYAKHLSVEGDAEHWVLGEDFLRRGKIEELLTSRFEIDFEKLCFAVRWHHHGQRSQREAAKRALAGLGDRAGEYKTIRDCISTGDHLSASERPEFMEKGSDFTLALQSIFANLELGREPRGAKLRYLPEVLTPDVAFPGKFPSGDSHEAKAYRANAYKPLVDGFKTGFHYALEKAQGVGELEGWIYSLLERYAWGIPSDMHALAEPRDVSLFDHERTTCAIGAAYALGRYSGERALRPAFLFIQADVSGVQDYIYSVAQVGPGGVAKRLRARSFFVTALTEVVVHRLRDELVPGYTLPIAAQILAGGGQFVLLAPNLEVVHSQLAVIERDVNEWLWHNLQGDLAVVFGKVAAGHDHLAITPKGDRSICDVLDELDRKVAAAKRHRLGMLLQRKNDQDQDEWVESAFKWEDTPYPPHGDCPSCRRLPAQAGEGTRVDERLCPRCSRDRILSEQIVEARYIAYYRGSEPPTPKEDTPDKDAVRLRRSTLTLFEANNARHVVLLEKLKDREAMDRWPYQLDGLGYEPPTPEGPALVRHFANHVPHWTELDDLKAFCTPQRACAQGRYDDDETCGIMVRPDGSHVGPGDFPILQTFGCISAASAEWPDGVLGAQLLGVLRADVDNLGWLFRHGIGEVKSLSRLATLSRMTDLFFSGWVNETLKRPPEGTRYNLIYTVYSGGDDLCLVGPWDVTVDFARHLAEEFERYAAGNPNVTISAAISVTKPKFPIATSARKAYELLKEAKNTGRNRFNLFGVITRWSRQPDEWVDLDEGLEQQLEEQRQHAMLLLNELCAWGRLLDEELCRWREAKPARYPVSTGFAHRLLGYAEMARRWEQEEQISTEDMLYLARLAYDLGRNVVNSDAVPEKTKRKLNRLTQLVSKEVMAGMRLPITYALYRNRERSRER